MSLEGELSLTASFSQGVVTNASVSRLQNAVFACDVILPVTPVDAMLFEIGGAGVGSWVGIRGGGITFRVRAGDGSTAKTTSTTNTVVLDIPVGNLPFDGNTHTIIWEFKISPGKIRLWVDGVSYGTSSTTQGGNLALNCWSGGDNGSYATPTSSGIVVGENNASWSGSVSSLRYYQNQTVQCGPWVLEDLDQYGSLDSLSFSLDSAVWTSADTCILKFEGAITGEGAVTASGSLTREGEATITGSGTLISDAYRERSAEAILTGTADVVAAAQRVRSGEGFFSGEGFLAATGGLEVNAIAFILGDGEIIVGATLIAAGRAGITGVTSLGASGYVYGQEWSPVAEDANTWTTVSPESNVWTTRTSGSNTWLQRG
jgi:hypothetical protein